MTIYLLHENGDDYHGSRIVAAFDSESSAITSKKAFESAQEPCSDCGHKYWYSIESVYVRDTSMRPGDERL